ncbi:ankyrin repeat and MYND domain-containing protein 1 [Spea bombifrons]|uniref:ankyrin repeat and MYND domain-containing protein 1 n=1 Tax=Spea bombifrons TaxID=233779 RepID=UPI00234AD2C3|nr:ankyrin repeat and MYND domain-containing protein 1 [Spea bombifrons]
MAGNHRSAPLNELCVHKNLKEQSKGQAQDKLCVWGHWEKHNRWNDHHNQPLEKDQIREVMMEDLETHKSKEDTCSNNITNDLGVEVHKETSVLDDLDSLDGKKGQQEKSRVNTPESTQREKDQQDMNIEGHWESLGREKSQMDTNLRKESVKVSSGAHELQEWPDGSCYRGNVSMNMKLGYGEFKWVNGESYAGEFYKDHQHGKGVYFWPDGSRFTGSFYLSRKEGYGTMAFPDSRKFQGLYKADVRFGPGIESYSDGSQDVGIWIGHHLIRFCNVIPGPFTVSCYPLLCQKLDDETSNNEGLSPRLDANLVEDPFYYRFKILLLEDSYTLPDRMYSYSSDTDHLPLPPSVRADFDHHFYSPAINQQEQSQNVQCSDQTKAVYLHVNKHRNSPEHCTWNISSIMCGNREQFGRKGPQELIAEKIIEMASVGDYDAVSNILRHDVAHVDVSDFNGNDALHTATVNGNNNIINLLLDNGADVNRQNDEGLSALALCMMAFYSTKTIWANVAERNLLTYEEKKNEGEMNPLLNDTILRDGDTDRSNSPPSDLKKRENLENKGFFPSFSLNSPNNREATMKLLLLRGADPNKCCVPMHALFLAVKAADVSTVQLLLERGARTDIRLATKHGSVTPLHVAAALPVPEGVRITEILLHAAADPNARAGDGDDVYEQDKGENTGPIAGFFTKGCLDSGSSLSHYCSRNPIVPVEGGRTPLHVACERQDNFKHARDIICLLLDHNAETNVLWSGHSPLSLAVASGNDLAVKELLARGAEPNLALTHGVGSALCAAVSTTYERQRTLAGRLALVDRLIRAGADILMPITLVAGKKTAVGTATDYAYYKFFKDKRIANTPYHALSPEEREIYNERRELLEHLSSLTRDAVILKDREWAKEGIFSASGVSRDSTIKRRVEHSTDESLQRKSFFKFCYQCGRSVGVKLMPCLRCYSIYFCSKQCKKRSWNELHKEECQLFTGNLINKKTSANKLEKAKTDGKVSPSKRVKSGNTTRTRVMSEDLPIIGENYSFN